MATRLIQLADGTLVEVEASSDDVQQISFKYADKVEETIERVKPILVRACEPVVGAWEELSKVTNVESAEVELGLSFEGEGNVYVTKAKAGANLTVRLVLKQKPTSEG